MSMLATILAAVALVPVPREQVWCEGTCTFAEKDIRFVWDAALPAEGATYPTSGARMTLKKVTDEALLEELLKSAPQGFTPMYYEIVAVRSLG